jgi:hypothetical protein
LKSRAGLSLSAEEARSLLILAWGFLGEADRIEFIARVQGGGAK